MYMSYESISGDFWGHEVQDVHVVLNESYKGEVFDEFIRQTVQGGPAESIIAIDDMTGESIEVSINELTPEQKHFLREVDARCSADEMLFEQVNQNLMVHMPKLAYSLANGEIHD